MPTFGSVCTGVGMFDLGLHRAGWSCRWQCEIEPERRRVLARYWPDVPRHEDLSAVKGADLERVALLVGGTPCQDLSVAGRGAGLAGTRSGLFFHFARLADEVAPAWVLWENVPGALSSNAGRDFATVLGTLTGYFPEPPPGGWRNAGICAGPRRSAAWRVLDAQTVGGCPLHGDYRGRGPVPQRRRRVFVVAVAGDGRELPLSASGLGPCRLARLPVRVLLEPESGARHFAPRKAKRKDAPRGAGGGAPECGETQVAACVNSDPSRKGMAGDDTHVVTTPLMAHSGIHERQQTFVTGPPVAAKRGNSSADHVGDESRLILGPLQGHHPRDTTDDNVVTHALRSEGADASEDGTGRGTPLVVTDGPVAPPLVSRSSRGGNTPLSPGFHTDSHIVATSEAYQCHGNNVGPMGTVRSGNGGLTGGVPFVVNAAESCAKESHARQSETARSLDTTGGFATNQGETVIAFESTAGTRSLNDGETSPPAGVGSGVGVPSAPAVCIKGAAKGAAIDAGPQRGEILEDASYTLNGVDRHGVQSGMVVRRLTPTECARLQGLPDDWLDIEPPLSDSAKYRYLGDGGVTFVLEWIGNRLRLVTEGG